MNYAIGDTVYWIEPPRAIRSGTITVISDGRYTIRRGYEAGMRLPESRLFPTYEAAAATLPPQPEEEKRTGHWHYWAG